MIGGGWDGAGLPVGAVVCAAEDCAVGAGGPDDAVADVVDAAEVGGGGGLEDLPLGVGGGGEEKRCEEEGGAHGGSLLVCGWGGGGILGGLNDSNILRGRAVWQALRLCFGVTIG